MARCIAKGVAHCKQAFGVHIGYHVHNCNRAEKVRLSSLHKLDLIIFFLTVPQIVVPIIWNVHTSMLFAFSPVSDT